MVAFIRKFSTASSLYYIPREFIQQLKTDKALVSFSQLQLEKKILENQLISALDGCHNLLQIKQVHAQILRKGLDQCCYVLTKLIRMLNKINIPMDSYPRLIFEQVKYRNPFLWTSLIRGYSLQGCLKESILLYGSMRREGIDPVSFTFSALFKACSETLDVSLGRQLHAQTILVGGFVSDLYVGNTLIDMYVKCGFLDCGCKVFDEMPEKDVISWTELIVAHMKTGDMKSASVLFDSLPLKDMVAWTAMVTGYTQNAKPREAIEYFERMQNSGVETDEVTLVGVISACAQLGAVKFADWVCDIAKRSGFGHRNNVVVGSALIDMYSKCGSLEDAYRIFEEMKERNVYTYSSMIVGLAMHGRAHAALQLFHEMLQMETKPNRVTFVGVLTACSHMGLVEQGRQLFASMEKCYGVVPSADHYACMVDLLGRAGHLKEAFELAQAMPVEPHGGVWGALLGACKIHGNPDIAGVAACHLFEIEPDAIGNYILLSNIYASARRWDDVSRVRKLMKEKGLKKNPGFSWVEGNKGDIHEFLSGDVTHSNFSEIKQVLEDILNRLTAHGYQPKLSSVPYDVADEEKKRILATHCEKLALAFGVLTTSAGCIIRIMKNLRICEDCHMFMCGTSQVTGREIIVRDNMRFHHFQDGKCSCGDFW
ncbi:pentatricopeptide repeat-containing protein At5g44230-like [Mangifera indica]|uniref:pentatricopeptide repeat-containing protein At5g44230-like n=1 Tax=Mangifera indica TaxID=29780 RepID=UPI001CFC0469|nr:pentatricopeptide repeat-containing protein At5g44230-like [Mangifera indica]